MRKIALVLGVMALTGCEAAEEEAAEEAPAEEVAAEPMAPDGGSFYGNFTLTDAEGNEFPVSMNADGTYSVDDGEGGTGSGSFEISDTGFCITPDDPEAEPGCITSGEAAEDGTWTNTNEQGESFTVSRAASGE